MKHHEIGICIGKDIVRTADMVIKMAEIRQAALGYKVFTAKGGVGFTKAPKWNRLP